MPQRKYALKPSEQDIINEYVLRIGGSPESREVHRSLLELVIGDMNTPIRKVTDIDVLQERDRIMQSKYSTEYKRKLIFNLRRFFLWYWEKNGISKNDISGVVLPKPEWKSKTADDMVTPEQIETVLKACHNARDRCFIAMLWDGSNRPVELLLLSWKDLKVDEHGYSFTTAAKTGMKRHIRLTTSQPYIESWKREYPGDACGDNPVFVSLRRITGVHKAWTMDSVQEMFSSMREETGIKAFKPGSIRPSRITDDVKNNYPESYLKMKNWGNLKSPMLDKYTNLRPDYVDGIALEKAGIKRDATTQVKRYKIEVPTCPSCQTLNVPGSMFCAKCHAPMTGAAKKKYEDLESSVSELQKQLQQMQERMELIYSGASFEFPGQPSDEELRSGIENPDNKKIRDARLSGLKKVSKR
jgi:integrase/ribosomal protein L37AE/L43A